MAQNPDDPGSEIDIGAVTVDENGLVKLVFDFTNAPNMKNEPFNAYFRVDSVASKKANQASGEVSFPGTETTIKLQNPTFRRKKAVVKLNWMQAGKSMWNLR